MTQERYQYLCNGCKEITFSQSAKLEECPYCFHTLGKPLDMQGEGKESKLVRVQNKLEREVEE